MARSEMNSIILNQPRRNKNRDTPEFIMVHSLEVEQMLLPETAHLIALKTFFKMLDLPLKFEQRRNAEFMSPGGRKIGLPFLVHGNELVAEFGDITRYLEKEGIGFLQDVTSTDEYDQEADLLNVDSVFTNAELYTCWMDKIVFETTHVRYGYPYEWPLCSIQCWLKKRKIQKILELEEYSEDFEQQVANECNRLSKKLSDQEWFNGISPTKFDALVFGHLFAITTTNLQNCMLAKQIKKNANLIQFCKRVEQLYFARPV